MGDGRDDQEYPTHPDPRGRPFVGRAQELDELRAERRRSAQGRLRLCLVIGGPGAGKTRLAEEHLSAEDEPSVHLVARSSGLRPDPPFAHWAAILEPFLPADVAASFREAHAHERVAERIVRMLAVVGARRPITVVLDDVHWADGSVWEVILRLSEDHPRCRVFVLATARPGMMPGQAGAADVLMALDREAIVHRLDLGPLGPKELGELGARLTGREVASPALVDWLVARSQGNIRIAVDLLEALEEEGGDPDAPDLRAMPSGLTPWVVAEVARLPPPESALLDLLAVVATPIDPGDLATIAEQPTAEVGVALDGLLRSELVVEHEHERSLTYEIAHPVVGELLYGQVNGARRRVLHRRVAGAMLESGQRQAATSHFLRSARVGDSQAVDALIRQLGDAGRRGSHEEVWAIVPALVDLLPSGDPRWLVVADSLSWPPVGSLTYKAEHFSISEMSALLKIEEQMVRMGDLERQASIRFRRAGFLAYGAGDKDSGQLECRHALELSRKAGREHEFRMAAIELAKMRGWFGDVRGQELASRQLLSDGEEAGDHQSIVATLGALGVALGLQGRFAEAETVLLRCIELTPATALYVPRPQAVAVLVVLQVLQGHVGAARARWSQAASENLDQRDHIWSSEVFSALIVGDLATVRQRANLARALEPGTQHSDPPWLVLLAAMAAAEAGSVADARRGLHMAGHDHRGGDLDIFSQFRLWGEAAVAWAEDRPGAATAVLERAVERLAAMHAPAVEAYLLADLVEVAVAAGERETAARAAHRAEEIARAIDAPSYQALRHFAWAWALLAVGQHAEAASAASRAVDGLAGSGLRLLEARARVALAIAVRGTDRRLAADALSLAAAAFDAAGATLRRERALRMLGQLGSSGRRAAARLGGPALTAREAEIARLAARGFTARQIGDGLHIGVRTVETHLARIYPKLGVASKQQLISRGAELGLVPFPHHLGEPPRSA